MTKHRTFLLTAAVVGMMGLGPGSDPARAQQVTASAFLDRNHVGIGTMFILTLSVEGTQQLDAEPSVPDLSGFATFVSSGRQTSFRMDNGITSVFLNLQYRFRADSEGEHRIGSATIQAGGSTLTTEPLTLRVSAAPPQRSTADGAMAGLDPRDLFIVAEPSTRSVLTNEPVVVSFRLFTRVDVTSYGVTRLPSADGFWVEEIPIPDPPVVQEIVRDGVQYISAVIHKVAYYPISPGTRTVEPIAIEAQVRVRSRDPFADVFGGFFDRSSLFDESIPVSAASEPVTIVVEPLPAGGPDTGFTGFVGELGVQTSLDRTVVATNDAVTLRVGIQGRGNLRGMAPPDLVFPPTVEAFAPEVADGLEATDRGISGRRTWEYVLIPRAPGRIELPGVNLGYFDPVAGAYRTASAPPLELEVTGRGPESALPGVPVRTSVETLRTDIRFIRTDTPRLSQVGRTVFQHPTFWLAFLLPAGAVAGAAGLGRRRARLAGDRPLARSRGAAKAARRRLAAAARLVDQDDHRAFCAELAHAIEGFVADKLDTSAAGLVRERMEDDLRSMGMAESTIELMASILAACDEMRFAPVAPTVTALQDLLERTTALLSDLGRQIR